MEEEKIIQLSLPKEFNDLIKNAICSFEDIPEPFEDILKKTINLSYLSRKILSISTSAFKYNGSKNDIVYPNSIINNYLTQKFIIFLNKPKLGGDLVVNNHIYGKSEIASEENRLVVMPTDYEYYLTPSTEDRFIIEGIIVFDESFN